MNAAKGLSRLQLGRDLDVQYKTAFVLAHKLREAIGSGQDKAVLSGHVEVDGAYFGGSVRQENRKEDRKDRRLAENQSGKRRVVVVMRERGGRTLPFVFRAEDEAVPTIRERVATAPRSTPTKPPGWDALHARFDTRRINHSIAFSDDGACTNQAESYFSRLRRAEWGQHHHISASTSAPTPGRWRGARTPAAGRTGRCTRSRPARRSAIRCRGCGRAIGSAPSGPSRGLIPAPRRRGAGMAIRQ